MSLESFLAREKGVAQRKRSVSSFPFLSKKKEPSDEFCEFLQLPLPHFSLVIRDFMEEEVFVYIDYHSWECKRNTHRKEESESVERGDEKGWHFLSQSCQTLSILSILLASLSWHHRDVSKHERESVRVNGRASLTVSLLVRRHFFPLSFHLSSSLHPCRGVFITNEWTEWLRRRKRKTGNITFLFSFCDGNQGGGVRDEGRRKISKRSGIYYFLRTGSK